MSETDNIPRQSGSVSGLNQSLSFNEVANLFYLPLAEAASTLGVCTSVLKRICRENGLIRWPYRKFLAGKTVEEIRKDAAREQNRELAELSNAKKGSEGSGTSPAAVMTSTLGIQLQNRTASSPQDASKLQRNSHAAGHGSQQQGNKHSQNARPQMSQPGYTRNIPTCLDEFKQGFPANGLSSVSMKWWGSSSPDVTDNMLEEEPTTEGVAKKQHSESANDAEMTEETPGMGTEKAESGSEGTALLASVRKRVAEDGRQSVKLGVSRAYGAFKLGRKQRSLLSRVFGSSFPNEWR